MRNFIPLCDKNFYDFSGRMSREDPEKDEIEAHGASAPEQTPIFTVLHGIEWLDSLGEQSL